jgi:hypothetical protein
MIKPLRAYHFFIWRVLVLIVPALFILAIAFRPASLSKNKIQNENDFRFGVKKMTNTTAQLDVELLNALKVPSCLVYVSTGSNELLVGKIDQQGSYKFEFPIGGSTHISIKLYDAIHKTVIMRQQLSYPNQ